MQRVENISIAAWPRVTSRFRPRVSPRTFAAILIASAALSAAFASLLPLQASILTVFLFAGPHNWFELRYFLMRLPVRFGKSRSFFVTAFAGIGLLTLAYIALPVLSAFSLWPEYAWPTVLASWNTVLLLWLGLLVWLRGKQKTRRCWSWAIPAALALCS